MAVLPFTTSLMATHMSSPDVGLAVIIYGFNALLASLLLSLLIFYVVREPDLLVDEVADGTLAAMVRQRWASIGIYVVALAIALIAPVVAVFLYLVRPSWPWPCRCSACIGTVDGRRDGRASACTVKLVPKEGLEPSRGLRLHGVQGAGWTSTGVYPRSGMGS